MTLGRSSTGSIKIKTDEAGGGLRAVNCACCGVCPENFIFTINGQEIEVSQADTGNWSGAICVGAITNASDSVVCEGSEIYGYTYEACVGEFITVSFACAQNKIVNLDIEITARSEATASCEVCDEEHHTGAILTITTLNWPDPLSLSTTQYLTGYFTSYPASVCYEPRSEGDITLEITIAPA